MSANIKLTVLDQQNVYLLTFDRPDSSANIFDVATLTELDERLKALSGDTGCQGVIFASAKRSIFIAGADINELAGVSSEKELRDIIRLGQQVFNRIAALRCITVAAIHGACLGGGFELCLACDYRIASNDRATQIGLPETQLGILPAWGGSTRLPRLIGLPAALDIILAGKRLAAVPALKRGLIDDVIPREHLLRFALEYTLKDKPARPAHALTNNPLVAGVIKRRAYAQVMKKTRGHYPAVPRALEVVTAGLRVSTDDALALEADAIVDLSRTAACRNLIRIFQLQERSKKAGNPKLKALPVRRAAVIGAGVMGAGIAQWISARGMSVLLRDINEQQVRKGLAAISKLYSDAVKRHILDRVAAQRGFERINPSAAEAPLKSIDLVIEAAVEEIEAKQKIFKRLDELAGSDTMLATNTSALSIDKIASATRRPGRVVGLHFFNPVHRMQLVEVVIGPRTDPAVAERALRAVQQMGKLPVVVRDAPGFIVNRILMPYLVEAGALFAQGAQPATVDAAMLDFGMPMGPLRLLDEVGIDIALHVAAHLSGSFGARMPVPPLLDAMVKGGLLGRKSGSGFYTYAGKGDPAPNEAARRLADGTGMAQAHVDEMQRRMVLLMVNEAARCIEEGVAAHPDDVDFAMIMGTGFAPFRGGPLTYADATGISNIVDEMLRLAETDPRFAPCNLLISMATSGKKFYVG